MTLEEKIDHIKQQLDDLKKESKKTSFIEELKNALKEQGIGSFSLVENPYNNELYVALPIDRVRWWIAIDKLPKGTMMDINYNMIFFYPS